MRHIACRHLAAQHLGVQLHNSGQRHDPEEDAAALMRLYTQAVHPKLISDYGLLVQWYTQKTMEQLIAWRQEHAQQEGEEEE
jgi:hypothetical protein